jgi:anti-anti-sigma factor
VCMQLLQVDVLPHRSVRLSGELDLSTVTKLTETLQGIVSSAGDLEVDLAGLSFMDGSGLRALVIAAERLKGRGRLILKAPSPSISRLFDLVRAHTFPNVEIVR